MARYPLYKHVENEPFEFIQYAPGNVCFKKHHQQVYPTSIHLSNKAL